MKNRIGEEFITNEGYVIKIVEYHNVSNCTILFNDENKTIRKNVHYSNIKKGTIKNLNKKSEIN